MPENCPYCHFPIKESVTGTACPECGANHHPDCWDQNGGCAVAGCEAGPRAGSERPVPPQAAARPAGQAPPPQSSTAPSQPGSPSRESAGNRRVAVGAGLGLVAGLLLGAVIASVIIGGGSDGPSQEEFDAARRAEKRAVAAQRRADERSDLLASRATSSSSGPGSYIAQLSSNRKRENAEAFASDLRSQGYPADVLWSSDYSNLTPGYWVVYAGLTDQSGASALVSQAKGLGVEAAFLRNAGG